MEKATLDSQSDHLDCCSCYVVFDAGKSLELTEIDKTRIHFVIQSQLTMNIIHSDPPEPPDRIVGHQLLSSSGIHQTTLLWKNLVVVCDAIANDLM